MNNFPRHKWYQFMTRRLIGRIYRLSHSYIRKKAGNKKPKYITGKWQSLPDQGTECKPKVAWVFAGNENLGSARLKGILINRYANQNTCGFISTVAYMQQKQDARLWWQQDEWLSVLKRADILVIQTWAGSTLDLLEDCRKHKVAAVFTLSDLMLSEIPRSLFELVDAVVVSSEKLKLEVSNFHNHVLLIDDPIEVPPGFSRESNDRGFHPELVWMGHPLNWPETKFVRGLLDTPEFHTLKFCTVTKHPEATHQWKLKTRWKDVSHSDIAVIPCKLDDWGSSKSSNRLASFMALGYPVIATPIPSYTKLIEHGINGFFAVSEKEWIEYIRLLRDPKLRDQIGNAARETHALKDITLKCVAQQWSALFNELANAKK